MDDLKKAILGAASSAVEVYQSSVDAELDYSKESLTAIEDILNEASGFVDEMPEENFQSIVQLIGSYVLAVADKQVDGRFLWSEEIGSPVFVAGEPNCSIAIAPFDKVAGRLKGDPADNIPFFYAGFSNSAMKAENGVNELYV
ncbi:MAG: hypothetical protein ACRBBN_07235 [Methyloligellaceae bacterium]